MLKKDYLYSWQLDEKMDSTFFSYLAIKDKR